MPPTSTMPNDWGKDEIYCEATCRPEDVLYEGSDDEDYSDPETRKLRYEDAGQRYLDGREPFLLTACLKGPFDPASGWTNPWQSKHRTASTQPHSRAIFNKLGKLEGHKRIASIPETVQVDTQDSLQCHLPSPESLKQASVTDPHPFLEDDEVVKVQNWRDAVKSVTLVKDAFWTSTPNQDQSTRKRRAKGSEWLRKLASKRRKTDVMESGSIDTPIHRRPQSANPDGNLARNNRSASPSVSFNSAPTELHSITRAPLAHQIPSRIRSHEPPKIIKENGATLSSALENRSSPEPSCLETLIGHLTSPGKPRNSLASNNADNPPTEMMVDDVSMAQTEDQVNVDESCGCFETQKDQSFCYKMRPRDGLMTDSPVRTAKEAHNCTEKSSKLSDAPSWSGLSSEVLGTTLQTTEDTSIPSVEDQLANANTEAQPMDILLSFDAENDDKPSVLSGLSSLSSVMLEPPTRCEFPNAVRLSLEDDANASASYLKNHERNTPPDPEWTDERKASETEYGLPRLTKDDASIQNETVVSSAHPTEGEVRSLCETPSVNALEPLVPVSCASDIPASIQPTEASTTNHAKACNGNTTADTHACQGIPDGPISNDPPKPPAPARFGQEKESSTVSISQQQGERNGSGHNIMSIKAVLEVASDDDENGHASPRATRTDSHQPQTYDTLALGKELKEGKVADTEAMEDQSTLHANNDMGREQRESVLASMCEQSPWAGSRFSQYAAIGFNKLSQDAPTLNLASTPQRGGMSSQVSAIAQTPWVQDPASLASVADGQPSNFAVPSLGSSTNSFMETIPVVVQQKSALESMPTPLLPARQTTPEPQFSVKSFATFMSPSPEQRHRQLPRASWRDSGNRLPSTQGILASATKNPWDQERPRRRVRWAPLPGEREDAIQDAPSSDTRGRPASPPPETPVSDLPISDDSKFANHFTAVAKRTNVLRQRLLPMESQQTQGSPAAMAEKFLEADGVRMSKLDKVESLDEIHAEQLQQREESQEPIDIVEDVFNEMGEYLKTWDVDAELDQARREESTGTPCLSMAPQSPW